MGWPGDPFQTSCNTIGATPGSYRTNIFQEVAGRLTVSSLWKHCKLVGGWTNPSEKNMLVKLDFYPGRGENKEYLSCHQVNFRGQGHVDTYLHVTTVCSWKLLPSSEFTPTSSPAPDAGCVLSLRKKKSPQLKL